MGEAPGQEEDEQGRPFVGDSGKILNNALTKVGLSRHQFNITNVCPYRPPKNDFTKLTPAQLEEGKRDLHALIEELQPSHILLLGATALSAVLGKVGIMAHRGSVYGNTIATIHPALVAYNPTQAIYLVKDLQRFRLLAEGRLPANPDRRLVINPTTEDLAEARHAMQHGRISLDIEANGNELACVGFGISPTYAISVPFDTPERREWIRQTCLDPTISWVLHNAGYDIAFMKHRCGLEVVGSIDDTMIMHHSLSPEMDKGLGVLTSLYTSQPYYKDMVSDWKNIKQDSLDTFWRYNALDCAVTIELYPILLRQLERQGLYETYRRRLAVLPHAIEMSCAGIRYDRIRAAELTNRVNKRIERWQKILDGRVGQDTLDAMKAAGIIPKKAPASLNVNSYPQIRHLLFQVMRLPSRKKTDAGSAAVDEKTLNRIFSNTPQREVRKLLRAVLEVRESRKFLSSYLKVRVSADGRVRTSYNPAGTETGRWSASKFLIVEGTNLQTVPPIWKQCFIADPGMVMWEADYSQIEARFVAYLARDAGQIKVFESGEDIHKYTASLIFGKPMDRITDAERQTAKKCVHALNYGIGPTTLMETVNKDGRDTGVWIDLNMARWVRERYLERFDPVVRWQKETWKEVQRTRKLTNIFGTQRIFLGSVTGEDAHKTMKEAIAFRPQSMVPDLMNQAIIKLRENPPVEGLTCTMQIHDALRGQFPRELQEPSLRAIREAMTIPMTIFGMTMTVPVDIKCGVRWSEMVKLKAS